MSIQISYWAGFMDGEGSIGLYQHNSSSGRKHLMLTVQIANTSHKTLLRLQEKFGGSIGKRPLEAGHKQLYNWAITSKAAANFLRAILPYLRIKRRHAELGLEAAKIFSNRRNHLKPYPPRIFVIRDTIRLLNHSQPE